MLLLKDDMIVLMKLLCRYHSTSSGEREIQRTMLELLNQLDGFDSRGDVKVGVVVYSTSTVCVIMFYPWLMSITEELQACSQVLCVHYCNWSSLVMEFENQRSFAKTW